MPSRALGAVLLSLGLAHSAIAAEVIERILAVVDQRPLLLSEVQVLERVKRLSFKEALEKAIDERLMYAEAARAPQSEVSPEEEKLAYSSLLSRVKDTPQGLTEDGLLALARREAVILKYVAFRFVPQIRISDEAVQSAYASDIAAHGGGLSFEEAEGAIRDRLFAQELDLRIEAWVKDLRSSAQIRYNDPEPGGAAEGP